MNIWKRYLFWHITRFTLFFSLCFFLVYSLIDLSAQIKHIHSHVWTDYLTFYGYQFIKRMDFIFPIAFAIGLVQVLTSFSANFELVALEMSGLSRRYLLTPFFALALILTTLIYASYEWVSPHARLAIEEFEVKNRRAPQLVHCTKPSVYAYSLENAEKLIFSYATPQDQTLHDVYLIYSPDDIWHAQTLSIKSKMGQFVDHIGRHPDGRHIIDCSLPSHLFKTVSFRLSRVKKQTNPYSLMSISALARPTRYDLPPRRKTLFYARLFLPLLPCLIAIAIPPFAISCARERVRPVLLYTLVLLFILCFFTLFSAMTILGEKQVFSPFFATSILPVTLFAFFIPTFIRKTR